MTCSNTLDLGNDQLQVLIVGSRTTLPGQLSGATRPPEFHGVLFNPLQVENGVHTN